MAGVEPEAGARPVDRDSDAEDRASSDDSSEKIVRRKKSKKSKKEKKEKKEKKRRREASAGSEESGGAPSPKKRRGAADADEGSDGDSEPKGSVADEAAADPDVWDLGDETEEWKRVLSRVGHEDDDDRRLLEDLEREDNVDQKEEDKKPASKKLIDTITLSRTRDVVPHCHLGFLFTKIVKGAFVRALAGQDKDGHKIYALFEVEDAKPTGVNPETGAAITYKVNDKVTDWLLLCRTGERPREMRLSAISDQRCTEKEFVTYLKRMERAERPVMSTKRANEKRTEIWKLYSDYYSQPLSTEQVDEIIHTRQRLRGTASVNLIRNKLILQQKLEQLTRLKIKEENDPLTELPPAALLEAIAEEKSRFAGVEDMRSESERDREREERGWQIYYEQQAQSKRHLETELSETEQKLKSVLYGQNSSFGTLAKITLRNAQGNKDRLEAEDPIDAIVFGRKQGSKASYWTVSENGYPEKEAMIKTFWDAKQKKEGHEAAESERLRHEELRVGTRPIKDLAAFIKDVAAHNAKEGAETATQSVPAKLSQEAAPASPAATAAAAASGKKRVSLQDFLSGAN